MPNYHFFMISKVTKIIIVHPIWTQEHLTWAKENENFIIFFHQKEDRPCFKAENILFEKIWSKFEVRNLVFILGWTILNKNIVELSIIYVLFIYCNHKSTVSPKKVGEIKVFVHIVLDVIGDEENLLERLNYSILGITVGGRELSLTMYQH